MSAEQEFKLVIRALQAALEELASANALIDLIFRHSDAELGVRLRPFQ